MCDVCDCYPDRHSSKLTPTLPPYCGLLDGSPIQSYCYSTIFDGVQKTGCELEYNGVMCSGCSHVICADEFGGGEGLEFDCSNASSDSSAKGSTCDGGDWKDFFLDPRGPAAVVPGSTPAPAEPTVVDPTPAPEPTPSGTGPEPTVADPEMTGSLQPSSADAINSSMPSAEPTSDASNLKMKAPFMLSAAVVMVLLVASVGGSL